MHRRRWTDPRRLVLTLHFIAAIAASVPLHAQDVDPDAARKQYDAEQSAIQEITRLGGWVETERRGKSDTVVEVNMAYHQPKGADRLDHSKRQDNANVSDEALAVVPAFVNLKRLLLKSTQATDEGLAHIRGMPHLELIVMWDATLITNKGVEHLTTIPSLKYVHLDHSQITDEALLHFSALESLEALVLQENNITDGGIRHLLPLKNLKTLAIGIGNCRLTDDGLQPIGTLENLELLDISYSDVTDDGLIHLVGLKKLKSLSVVQTKVTGEGAELLQQAIPDLRVDR